MGNARQHQSLEIKGFPILNQDDARNRQEQFEFLYDLQTMIGRGKLARVYCFFEGIGCGSAEQRAYNAIRKNAVRSGGTLAVIINIEDGVIQDPWDTKPKPILIVDSKIYKQV